MRGSIIIPTLSFVRSVVARRLRGVVCALAFWTAALLPIAYTPLVVLEHSLVANPWTLAKLFALNLVALVVGHSYSLGETDDEHDDASKEIGVGADSKASVVLSD